MLTKFYVCSKISDASNCCTEDREEQVIVATHCYTRLESVAKYSLHSAAI